VINFQIFKERWLHSSFSIQQVHLGICSKKQT